MSGVQFHPVCEAFPLMDEDALGELAADIRANGQREAIWKHRSGAIIDGRNRYLACARAGLAPKYRKYEGPDSSLPGFVVSLNIQRRHLNESQRAMVAAKLANLGHGERADLKTGRSAALPPITQEKAASMLNIGERTVRQARVVQEKAVPELARAVETGEVSVGAAAVVAELPASEQRAAVDRRTVPEVAKKVSAAKVSGLRKLAHRAEKKLQQQLSKDHERAVTELRAWVERFAHVKTLARVVAGVRRALKEAQ